MARSEKILIVEDEKGIRVLLADVLSSEGFEVISVKDGQESLDQMEDSKFDLVITDINMPRLDGIEMLKRMKKAGRKEKVIVITADTLDRRLEDGELPSVLTQLQKPFRIDNFVEVVIGAMANSK